MRKGRVWEQKRECDKERERKEKKRETRREREREREIDIVDALRELLLRGLPTYWK